MINNILALNLTNHVKNIHLRRKWMCSFCEKEQASEFSHIRHVENCSKVNDEQEWDPDENAYLTLYNIDLTPESKTYLIKNVIRRNELKVQRIAV